MVYGGRSETLPHSNLPAAKLAQPGMGSLLRRGSRTQSRTHHGGLCVPRAPICEMGTERLPLSHSTVHTEELAPATSAGFSELLAPLWAPGTQTHWTDDLSHLASARF